MELPDVIVEGDRILVDKSAYGLRVPFTTFRLTRGEDPQRGDIAIFPSPEDGITLVKRVIGLPGDSVEMRDERLLINGVETSYAPAQAGRRRRNCPPRRACRSAAISPRTWPSVRTMIHALAGSMMPPVVRPGSSCRWGNT